MCVVWFEEVITCGYALVPYIYQGNKKEAGSGLIQCENSLRFE